MALIGLCVKFGALLGDNVTSEDPHDHTWAIVFAMLGLALMNLMVNVMQGPARTLVNDVVPEEKLQLGNAMVSTVMGLANIIANIIGALFITVKDPYFFLFILGVEFVIFIDPDHVLCKRETIQKTCWRTPSKHRWCIQ